MVDPGPRRAPSDPRRTEIGPTDGWREFRAPGGSLLGGFRLPDSPFARLGVAHAAGAAGDALVTIALAKTLFFVSPNEARGKVILYLLLTLAPFAIVSPFIGPLIDRFSANRRWVIVITAAARAVLCLLMAGDVHSLRLFPEAFCALVLSKAYAVARSSIVPSVVPAARELVRANSRLSLIGGLAGFVIALPGGLLSSIPRLGAPWVLGLAFFLFAAAAAFSARITLHDGAASVPSTTPRATPTLPAVHNPSNARSTTRSTTASQPSSTNVGPQHRRAWFAPQMHTPITRLRLATVAMSVQRALVGMVAFLVAFTLKREGGSTAWLGAIGAAGLGGGLVGAALAPRLRSWLSEERILLVSLVGVGVVSVYGTIQPDRAASALVAFVIGTTAGVSRLAFDALVQRESPEAERASAFARYETRFQLVWVLGALIPVVFEISRFVGFAIMSMVAVAAIAVQIGGESALAQIDRTLAAGASKWRNPDRPEADDWTVDSDR